MSCFIKKPHESMLFRARLNTNEVNMMNLICKGLTEWESELHYNKKDISNIDKKDIKREFKYETVELIELMGVSQQALSKTLKETTTSVMQKVISIPKNKGGFTSYGLCSFADYDNGILTLKIEEDTAEVLLPRLKNFCLTDAKLSLSLSGIYEKRILDLISRFKNKSEYQIGIKDFCDLLEIDFSKYARFEVFNRSALKEPIGRLIAASNGMWTAKKEWLPKKDKKGKLVKDENGEIIKELRKGKGYTISKTGRAYKDTDIITFKLKYTEPKIDIKTIEDDIEKIGFEQLSLSQISNIIVNCSDVSSLTELALSRETLIDFMRMATQRDEHDDARKVWTRLILLPE